MFNETLEIVRGKEEVMNECCDPLLCDPAVPGSCEPGCC
jgi:hypothetical protein